MRQVIGAWLLIVTLLGLTACSQEDPTPEERDQIFKDLQKQMGEHEKGAEEARAKIKDLRAQLEKVEPNSLTKKDLQRDLAKAQASLLLNEQKARYFKIRAERRKVVDRASYRQSLVGKKEWPDPREYSEYLVNRRLAEADPNWSKRVPKLQDRLSKQVSAEKKAEPEKKGH